MNKNKFYVNSILTFIFQVVSIINGIIIPKLFIEQYGSVINGTIATINQLTGFLGIMETGLGSVASYAFYKSFSGVEGYDLATVKYTIQRYYKKIAFISICISVVLAFVLPFFLGNGLYFRFNFDLIIIVSVGYFVNYYLGITNQLLLTADCRQYINYILQIVSTIIQFVLSVIMIKNNIDVRILKLFCAIIACMRPIALHIYVKRYYSCHNENVRINNDIIKQRWNNFGQSIAYYIHTQTDMIVIMCFLSVTENSIYAIYMSIITAVRNVITMVVKNYEPILGKVCASQTKKEGEIKEMFNIYMIINGFLINVLFPVLAVLLLPFVSFYTEKFDIDYVRPLLAMMLVLAEYIYVWRTPYNSFVNVNGLFKETQVSAFLEASINIIGSIILVNHLGIIGVAFATVVAMLSRAIYYYCYVKKNLLDISIDDAIRSIIPTGVGLVFIIVVFKFIKLSVVNNFAIFMIYALFMTGTMLLIQALFYYILYPAEMKKIINFSRKK